ncbi:MAG: MFS transporter [Mobilitalea sp.]
MSKKTNGNININSNIDSKINSNISRNIKTDYIYCFFKNFDISNSIWVLYLVYKGMSLWQIGIVEGIYHLTSFLFEVPTGALADLLGRKKAILVGRICSALSSILCLFGHNMWHFALAFAISAIGQNLNSGSEEALVYDSMKQSGQENRYIKVNSRLNVIIEIAQGTATVLGGVIAEYSFAWCYIISVIIALIALVPAVLFTEPDINGESKKDDLENSIVRIQLKNKINVISVLKEHFRISITIIRSDTKLRNILLYYPMVFTFHTIVFFYGQEFFSSLGLNKIEISMIMLLASGISLLGAITSERFLLFFDHKAKYVASTIMGIGIIVMSRHNLIVSVIAFAIINYANAVLYPIQSQAINELIPSKQRATIISVNSMIFSILMFVLFPLCGFIADKSDLHFVFLGLGILQLLIMLSINRKNRKYFADRSGR